MVRRIVVLEERFYLALQDGPEQEGKFYPTRKAAEAELKTRLKSDQRGVCVMSTGWREVEP